MNYVIQANINKDGHPGLIETIDFKGKPDLKTALSEVVPYVESLGDKHGFVLLGVKSPLARGAFVDGRWHAEPKGIVDSTDWPKKHQNDRVQAEQSEPTILTRVR